MTRKGYKQTAEHKAKVSAAKKGKKHTPESRAKMSAAKKGRKLSPEHRAKLSAAQRAHQHGKLGVGWKGEAASSGVIHTVLNRHHPRTGLCERCGRNDGRPTEYAFLKHPLPHTRNRSDYAELCRRCHRQMDAWMLRDNREIW